MSAAGALAATVHRIMRVLAEHHVRTWKNGSGPGYGWSCGESLHSPESPFYQQGCGATSATPERFGALDSGQQAHEGARRHVAEHIASALVEDSQADSRAVGLAVLNPADRDGLHDPRCGGCNGEQTSATCPYSVKQRRAAQQGASVSQAGLADG